MPTFRKLSILAILVVLSAPLFAAVQVVDGVKWYYQYNSSISTGSSYVSGAEIIAGEDLYTGNLKVPASLGGYAVKAIGNSAFRNCKGLAAVELPADVVRIGSYAFYESTLAYIALPTGLKGVANKAFANCYSLTEIDLPDTVSNMGTEVFYGCKNLTRVHWAKAATTIPNYAFRCCYNLESVDISEGVTSFGEGAFEDCYRLKRLYIPSTLTIVGKYAFFHVGGAMEEITIGAGNVNFKVVDGCLVSSSGATLYMAPGGQDHVTIPDGVKAIPEYAFHYGKLSSIDIPASVTMIGQSAFYSCSNLQSVTIPANVTTINASTFSYCSNLKTAIIPEGVTTISSSAFYSCSSLQAVTIPAGVVTIGSSAFSGCSSLRTVTVPEGVKTVDEYAFAYCSSLKTVTISEGVTTIGSHAFADCSSLQSLSIPAGLAAIGSYAFSWCSNLQAVTIPASVTTIGSSSFYNCYGLKRVTFQGPPPDLTGSSILDYGEIIVPREYGALWQQVAGLGVLSGFAQSGRPEVTIVSVTVRTNDPTVLDVVYRVASTSPRVKVRALAFENGVRSFANVVKVTDLIDGTEANIGDQVLANVAHTLSWRVSTDWKVDLAKVTFELLAVEDQLLPLELSTIPATTTHPKMQVSWNALTEAQFYDALLWLYADGDAGLTLTDGILKRKSDGYVLAGGATTSIWSGRYSKNLTGTSAYYNFANAGEYVFSKMGFSVLSGDELEYAKKRTRLALAPSGARQYAYRLMD